MNRLAAAAMRLDRSTTQLRINPPTWRVLRIGGILLTSGLFLFVITVPVTSIFTLPLIAFWAYIGSLYCKIWRSYDYARFWLICAGILLGVLTFALKYAFYYLF